MEKDILNYFKEKGLNIRYCKDKKTGDNWYVVSDLFKALGYKNACKKVQDICHDYRKYQFDSAGGKQYYLCVNFMELIKVILSFRKNKEFEEIQNFIYYKLTH